jgi:hypothetical protein
MEKMRNTYKIVVGKHVRRRPLERQRHEWEDNIKTGLK